ncbi:Sporulation initiation inhibitor protein Soj (plasmid) [Mycobacterium sp. THAF192]|nr:Sporulation initiation inhibitor protein Soj [Mycobacterium sp. THAF192]
MIYGFLNQKGGVGKTTASINVSMELARRGHKVLHIDADPQESSMDWARARAEADYPLSVNVIHYARSTLHRDISGHVEHYDDIVVDGPGRGDDELTRSAMLAVDMVIIPMQPSGLDAWASSQVIDTLELTRQYKPDIAAAFLISRRITNAAITRDIKRGLAEVSQVRLLETSIAQRVAYAESMTRGQAVFEFAPGSQAEAEIVSLTDELEHLWAADSVPQ